MTMSLVADIRHHLAEYLSEVATLDQFYDWLIAATWDIERRNDPAAEDLTYAIKLPIAEYSGGHITEADARQLLQPLVATAPAPTPV